MRTVDGEPIPRSVPTPGAQYVKSLGGSVWLGAVVIVAERGVADFDLCSFESHVPRVSDVVERDLSFISIILSAARVGVVTFALVNRQFGGHVRR